MLAEINTATDALCSGLVQPFVLQKTERGPWKLKGPGEPKVEQKTAGMSPRPCALSPTWIPGLGVIAYNLFLCLFYFNHFLEVWLIYKKLYIFNV